MIKEGEKVKVDPRLTGLDEWIEGTVIDIVLKLVYRPLNTFAKQSYIIY